MEQSTQDLHSGQVKPQAVGDATNSKLDHPLANQLIREPHHQTTNNQIQISDQPHSSQTDDDKKINTTTIETTWKRWLILFLFSANSGNKSFQWIQVSASTQKLAFFYDVDNYVINGTAVIFMIAFLVLSVPACFVIDQVGIRKTFLLSTFLSALGTVIKMFACNEQGIYLLFISLIIVSTGEQLVFCVPNRLASIWFPDAEVSRALALAMFGMTSGAAIGFIVPQTVMDGLETKEEIAAGLYQIFLWNCIFSVASFVIDYFLFDEAPKFAPGEARLAQMQQEQEKRAQTESRGLASQAAQLLRQMSHLVQDKELLLITLAYSISFGVYCTVLPILNQEIQPFWPGDDLLIGRTGFVIISGGCLATPLWGYLLDKSHRFRLTNIISTLLEALAVGLLGWSIACAHSRLLIYGAGVFLGITSQGAMIASLEMSIEVTYPQPELVTSTIVNISSQIVGAPLVFISSFLNDNYGIVALSTFYVSLNIIAVLLLLCGKSTLKRQAAVESGRQAPTTKNDDNKLSQSS